MDQATVERLKKQIETWERLKFKADVLTRDLEGIQNVQARLEGFSEQRTCRELSFACPNLGCEVKFEWHSLGLPMGPLVTFLVEYLEAHQSAAVQAERAALAEIQV